MTPEKYRLKSEKEKTKDPEGYRLRNRAYANKNPDARRKKARDRAAKLRKLDREGCNAKARAYQTVARALPENRPMQVAAILADRMGGTNGAPKFSVLGYSLEDLKAHIEARFLPGMTWSNHGVWELDHIVPICVLRAAGVTDPAQVHKLENLQPLWAESNSKKGTRYDPGQNVFPGLAPVFKRSDQNAVHCYIHDDGRMFCGPRWKLKEVHGDCVRALFNERSPAKKSRGWVLAE